jgi:CO/xanthine dehydrogenase FAD-binding subunit
MAAALLALDANVTIAAGTGTRTIAIERFLGERQNTLVTSVSFTRPPKDRFRYAKVIRRRPVSAAVLTIAAVLPEKRGKITGARIAYGAMAPTAIRARPVETALEGKALSEATIAASASLATHGTMPADDAYASEWYRREILPVHLRRLLAA